MSRNPFLDLGFPPEDAAALHIRSQLVATLEHHIDRKGWSQTAAARAPHTRDGLSQRHLNQLVSNVGRATVTKLIPKELTKWEKTRDISVRAKRRTEILREIFG